MQDFHKMTIPELERALIAAEATMEASFKAAREAASDISFIKVCVRVRNGEDVFNSLRPKALRCRFHNGYSSPIPGCSCGDCTTARDGLSGSKPALRKDMDSRPPQPGRTNA